MFHSENSSLVREYASERLVIEAWGKDSLRVRGTMRACFEDQNWALVPRETAETPEISIRGDGSASITNGRITARVDPRGQVAFLNRKGEVLLEEFMRVRLGNMESGDGEEAYAILEKYLRLRERLRPYLRGLMSAAHTKGSPIIRPLFYDFPEDGQTWSVDDAYMFGPEVLVAPILFEGQRTREVYLPAGARWVRHGNGEVFDGGQVVNQPAPLDQMPVFFREGGSAWSLVDKSNPA